MAGYDLAPHECLNLEAYESAELDVQVKQIAEALDGLPWIEAPLGAGDAIPPDAVEDVPVTTRAVWRFWVN